MISKDIYGATLTSAYDDAVKQDSRDFTARILIGGVELDGGIRRMEITKGSCADTEFGVGGVIGFSLTAEMLGLTTPVLKGQIIEAQIGLMVDAEDEDYTYIKMGEFVVSEAKKTAYVTNISAHGRLVAYSGKMLDVINNIVTDDGEIIVVSQGELMAYPPVVESQTLSALAQKVAYRLGCTVTFDAGIDTSLTIDTALTGMSVYQVVQIMASVIGGYVTDTPEGNVRFRRFKDTPTLECEAGQMLSLPDMDDDFTITGMKCVVSEASAMDDGTTIPAVSYVSGSPVNYTIENPYVTQNLFSALTYLIGYSYTPGSIDLSLGDPRLQGDDVLQVTDIDDSVHIVPCHQITHIYDGGFFSRVEAAPATSIQNNIGTQAPMERLAQETRASFTAVKESVKEIKTIAGDTAQHFWMVEEGTDTGAHITEVTKEEFLDDPENGGGNILMRSNGMAVRGGLTEVATFGADGSIIGQEDQSHQELNYHAMKMVDADGNEYLHISDLRDATGKYEATDTFTGDGTTTAFRLTFSGVSSLIVTVGGTPVTAYTLDVIDGYAWITFTSAPTGQIVATYQTTSADLKAYTLGTRLGDIGPYSAAIGKDNEASGRHSKAFGRELVSEGEDTTVIGKKNLTTDAAFVVGNGDATESDAMKLDWNGNLTIAGTLTQASDKDLKAHIGYLGDDAIELIRGLKPVSYLMYGSPHAGFYAQEVPDRWTLVRDFNGHLSLDYIGLIAPLVKYCQHLEERIEKLEGK